jgi:hypothetical protein
MNISESSKLFETALAEPEAPPAQAPRGRGRPPKNTSPMLEISDIQKEADKMVKKSRSKAKPKKTVPETVIEHLIQPTETNNTIVMKNQILQRIILNVENFGHHLTFIKDSEKYVNSLHSKSLEELQGILDTIQSTITMNNLSLQLKQGFFLFSRVSEYATQEFAGLKTHGMTDALMQNQAEISMIMKELAIDLSPKVSAFSRPELRLGMLFVMAIVQTDQNNRLLEAIRKDVKNAPDGAKKEDLEKKFGDL